MNLIIEDLINSFESNCKNSNQKYEQFVSHVYITFEKKVKSIKSPTIKDKYKKLQKSILQYIIANKREIINKLK